MDGLSNWFVRRSRERYWSGDKRSTEKLDAYWTLYECLLTTSKLIAPFTPFLAETMWRNLAGVFGERAIDSVHLCDYPEADDSVIDETLSSRMRLAREISSLGRAARMNARLKVRQPLKHVEVVLADDSHRAWLESHAALVAEELNVLEVHFSQQAADYITYEVKPNFKLLGKRLGKDMPTVKKLLAQANGGRLLEQLEADGCLSLELDNGNRVELTSEDVEIEIRAKEGWAAAQGRGCVVVLSTDLTPPLIRRGMANDLVRFIQERRKELDLAYTDRIHVALVTEDPDLRTAIAENQAFIQGETLTDEFSDKPLTGCEPQPIEMGGVAGTLFVRKCGT